MRGSPPPVLGMHHYRKPRFSEDCGCMAGMAAVLLPSRQQLSQDSQSTKNAGDRNGQAARALQLKKACTWATGLCSEAVALSSSGHCTGTRAGQIQDAGVCWLLCLLQDFSKTLPFTGSLQEGASLSKH